jgi:hypothetical protein
MATVHRWVLSLTPALAAAAISVALLAGCDRPATETAPPITLWTRPTLSAVPGTPATSEPDADGVALIGVGFAEDGALIMVRFSGPAKLVQGWTQGSIYVVDEATRQSYDQVPVAPVIGPLFSKPRSDGQPGYVMLNNPRPGLTFSSSVTVVLGRYKREHIKLQ